MILKNVLKKNPEGSKQELFWSLIIEPGYVQSGIWRIWEESAQIMYSSGSMAWKTDEELLNSVDGVLSSCIQKIPDEVEEPTKTVFGLVSSWVNGGEIKEEHLERIKNICKKLDLKPAGFVVIPESLAYLMKLRESSPTNAVFIGVYEEDIELSIFRLGNLSGNTVVARSVSMFDDVVEGLVRLARSENIPSRFILYNGKESDIEENRQSLINSDWEGLTDVKLLHPPKIEIITPKEKIIAVSLAGASEMADINSVDENYSEGKDYKNDLESPLFEPEEYETDEEIEKKENDRSASSDEEMSAEEMGFVGDTVVQEKEENIDNGDNFESAEIPSVVNEDGGSKKQNLKKLSITGATNPLKLIKFKNPLAPALKFFKKGIFLSGLMVFFVVFIAGFVWWWVYPKAEVTLFVSPKVLKEDFSIIASSDGDGQESVSFNEIKISLTSEKTKSATGTMTTGEKAKGEITLYRTGGQVTLSSGATILGPGGLRFTLDEDAELASGSASSPSTQKVAVTAEDIGAQYNLAGDTVFSVANYSTSDLEAKNENSFSGGSSREVSAVSKEDLEELFDNLLDELKNQAIKQLYENTSGSEILVEDSLVFTKETETYSRNVGDEATTVSLKLQLNFTAIVLNKDELIAMSRKMLEEKVPEGYILRDDQIQTDFDIEESDEENDEYEIKTIVSANLLPQTDSSEISKKITGKSLDAARKTLEEQVPSYVRSEFNFNVNLPGKLKTLPHLTKNIVITFSAER
jgi:hypothetical protein